MDRRANLLVLWTDEQRADTLACYGNTVIGMPNLDRLARESTVFRNAYCTSPVCTPSRGSVLTGRWPHHHGAIMNNIPLRTDCPTLPELCDPEYATAYIGKWHLGDEIYAQHGWDEWVNVDDQYYHWYAAGRDRADRCPYHHWLLDLGYTPDREDGVFSRDFVASLPEAHSKPKFQADRAIDFIARQGHQPWILSVNVLEPHMPFTGPRNDCYDPATLPVSPNFMVAPGADCLLRTRALAAIQGHRGTASFNPAQEDSIRRCLANYWGLCSQVDHHFGRILEALERQGLYDDTLIVFTSDHGDQMGSHRLLGKGVMFEESARIPLTVKLPGQRQGRVVTNPVSQVDLVPSILEAVGAEVPADLDGVSLLPSLRCGDEPQRDVPLVWHVDDGHDNDNHLDRDNAELAALGSEEAILAALRGETRCLVTPDRWKLVWSMRDEVELYDLDHDPHELTNLGSASAHRGRVAELQARLLSWQAAVGDPTPLPG